MRKPPSLRAIVRAPKTFAIAMYHAWLYRREGKPVLTPDKILGHRRAHCSVCEHNFHGFCNLCVCLIDSKTMISSESCPDDPPRWFELTPPVKDDTSGC